MRFPRSYTVAELCTLVAGRVLGDPERTVSGLNEVHKVEFGDLSFVDNAKYYARCLTSEAAAVLINAEVPCPEDKSLILHPDPISAYNRLVRYFSPFELRSELISPEAKIDPSAIIAPGVYIGPNVIIGPHSVIHPQATIYDGTEIGKDVIIHAGCIIGSDAYYYKRRPARYEKLLSCGKTIIEDEVEIGPCCSIARGVTGNTVIGEGTKIDAHVHIAHGVVVGKRCLFAAQVGIAGKTIIEDDVILWGQVGVSKSLRIGQKAIVLAQSGVSKSLAGGRTYFGSPAEEARDYYRHTAGVRRLTKNARKSLTE